MNTIKWFNNYEKEGVGDIYEGAFEIKNFENGQLILKADDKQFILNPNHTQFRKYHKGHIGNIYSTYAISDLLLHRKNLHRIDKRMLNFGTHCVVIKDAKKFVDSIFAKLTEMNYTFSHKIVSYKKFTNKDINLSLFHKNHLLSYQKEYRIIVWTKENLPLRFEIGSIENYAEIYSAEELIKNFTIGFQE
ncbi:hypothetical protein [Flavobacterium rhizosphaerae]|uniref:Uncharacterized protein n=1 Tax=Flavobacterium rhizosphaerae TaxID=3163298 RepID=A0ABW8YZD7_9FLAO